MKLLSIATTALLATAATARSTAFFSSSDIVPQTDYPVPGDNPLLHCSDPKDDLLVIKKVDIDPNPPAAGKNLTIAAEGALTTDIEEGAKIHLEVKYGLIRILRQDMDLCETVQNVDLECPLKEGPLKLSKEVALPSAIPPGKYTVLAEVTDKDDKRITCLTATVQFHGGSSAGLFKQDM